MVFNIRSFTGKLTPPYQLLMSPITEWDDWMTMQNEMGEGIISCKVP